MAGHDKLSSTETATLGGGCFWCLEAVFNELQGVSRVSSGYAGGDTENPTYQQVCSGRTGHAEVVQIEFSPDVIQFNDILEVFFTIHDPTTLNRQGADIGSQYRSIIFYHSEDQKKTAHELLKQLDAENIFSLPVVTEVIPFDKFYSAEAYHQNYFSRNMGKPYCQAVISPKLNKFRHKYQQMIKPGQG